MFTRFALAAVVAATLFAGLATAQTATDRPAVEKQIIANQKAVMDAIMKGDPKTFHSYVLPDSFAMGGNGMVKAADIDKFMGQMKVQCKFTKWGLGDSTFYWLNDSTVVHMFKATVDGTCQGKPEQPTWASTVWVNKNGKWLGGFHHESPMAPPVPAAKK